MLSEDEQHPVDQLAEEFAERIRSGETPQIEDYCGAHPEHAEMIRAVFPSIQMVERANQREEQHRRSGESESRSSSILSMPETLGDFQMIREIGRGGMGVVYEALQKSLKRHVALKVISALIAGSEKQLRRFRREAESVASLHHSNIVPVFGIGEDHGLQYYAMQLIDGVTLAEIINHLRRVPNLTLSAAKDTETVGHSDEHTPGGSSASRRFGSNEAVLRLLGTMPSADVNLLQSGLSVDLSVDLSGDLSKTPDPLAVTMIQNSDDDPESVAVTRANAATDDDSHELDQLRPAEDVSLNRSYFRNIARLIADVANAMDYAHRQGILHRDLKPANLILDRDGTIWVADFGLARQADLDGVTQTGEIVGTLRYMAPEQLRGQADIRTDIFALGLTLYELLALKPAVAAPQVLDAQGRKSVAPLRSSRPEIPADLETITLKACMLEPERRYQSAREFEADLHRFLEDRPIHARRVTPIERLWRWSKRNPQIASLSAATLFLLFTIVIILGFSYRRIQKTLTARNEQYERAEKNLDEKTIALKNVELEQARAETNLNLAIAAFEEVFNNIAARGRSESLLDALSEEELLPATDAVLSNADVTLLETLLGFFDRLAAENSKDLSMESAIARRRVGDIQQQLGRLENAQKSYLTALEAYRVIASRNPDQASPLLAQAEILHQLMLTSMKRGKLTTAIETLDDLRTVLKQNPIVTESADGKYVLANAINSVVSFGLRTMGDPGQRPKGPLQGRIIAATEALSPALAERVRREAEANTEAFEILQSLTKEQPSNVAYRIALAQATKDKARLAQMSRDQNQADEAMSAAIKILEDLHQEFPASDRFKYEFAETLSTVLSLRPADMQRLMRSQQLSRELVEEHPTVPEYRSLYAMTLARIAGLQFFQGQTEPAEKMLQESVSHQQHLADQFPDVLLYQFSLVRTLQQLATVYADGKRPDQARKTLDTAITRMESMSSRTRFRGPVHQMLTRLRESRAKLGN